MLEKINEKVDVITIFKHEEGLSIYKIRWHGRDHKITQFGYHHKNKEGRFVYHYFSVCTDTLAFKLRLDTETLSWTLKEVSDGFPN